MRRRSLTQVLAVVSWMTAAVPAAMASPAPLPPRALQVAAHDLAGASQELLTLAVAEMRRSLGYVPTPIEWAWVPQGAQGAADVNVIVLESAPASLPAGILAASMASVSPPTSWVYLDRVRGALGDPGRREPDALVARALGRVIAHELVHALAPETPHARHGLMSERLSPSALRGVSLALDASSRSALQRGVLTAIETRPLAAAGTKG